MKMPYVKITAIILSLALFGMAQLFPCTIIAVGKKASTDGSVITSHTGCCEECRIHVVPGQIFKKVLPVPVFYGLQEIRTPLKNYGRILGYIPGVKQTYSYIHSGYSHINEHQLAIGESTISQREEVKFGVGEGKQIMTIEQAMALALQRCRTARQALDLITSLLEKYGFLPSCADDGEALAIADKNEVWILEVFSVGKDWEPEGGKPGAVWAARRLPDDQVAVVPNWSIIKKIDPDDPDHSRASTNYKQFAVRKGWFNPGSGESFNWQKVYSPLPREWATGRFWLFSHCFAQKTSHLPRRTLDPKTSGYDAYHQYVEPLSTYPFSFKPKKKLSVQEIIKFQRSVFPGTIYDMTADRDWLVPDGKGGLKKSPLTTPFPTRSMRDLLDITYRRMVSRGGYGMVAQLRDWLPDPIGGVYWFYLDNQHTSTYVPIYAGVTRIYKPYQIYDPDRFSEDSARWLIDFVDNLLYLRWQDGIRDLRRQRDPLEAAFFKNILKVDQQAVRVYGRSPRKARRILTDFTHACMVKVLKLYRNLRNLLITKYTNNKQGI